jgi:hypothetical protein
MTQPLGDYPQGTYPPPGPPLSPPGQPPRRRTPWWVWVLSGCGGCAVLALIALIVISVMTVNAVQKAAKEIGPISNASVRQSLGADVPLYPGSTLDPTSTQFAAVTIRTMLGGRLIKGIGAMFTQDSPEKVLQFYSDQLKANGWQAGPQQNTGMQEQHQYRKGADMVLVQVQRQPGQGTMITLIRAEFGGGQKAPGPTPRATPAPQQ